MKRIIYSLITCLTTCQTILLLLLAIVLSSFTANSKNLNPDKELKYCSAQIKKALSGLSDYNLMPKCIPQGQDNWSCSSYNDWTGGFWPGILWFDYEFTKDDSIKAKAISFTESMMSLTSIKATTHDLGFMVYCSMGNAYRITKDPEYKKAILHTSDSLATLFNIKVGTILSWPLMVKRMNWPHNTIIDNMMNLEMLFWASKNGGSHRLYEIAEKHAYTTMKNHFRDDYTCYHVVVYDTITGQKIKGVTHQGYADNTMWARGQAWAIYGFTLTARETGNPEYLDFAKKVSQAYIDRLPSDLIPYWDFDAPNIPDEPRDASAAAVAASAFLELSVLVKDEKQAKYYKNIALKILKSLSSENYQSRDENTAFLSHSTGHKPNNSEIDMPIIYADYYYIEALTRLRKINNGMSIYE
jgi:unsaturated chondroitin disaccharide hydrolase